MAKGCGEVNKYGVVCGLSDGHEGPHEAYRMVAEPPPFKIKPRDRFALATIRAWIVLATAGGVAPEKIAGAEECFHEIERWQKENREKVKTPD